MTLVVGRISNGSITVVSDTKLTNEMTKAPIPITKGMVKTKIIAPGLTISFAGNSSLADKAVRMVRPTMSASEAAQTLLQVHQSVELAHSADFLVAALEPQAALFSIKDGEIVEGSEGWVGSYEAYRAYRALEMGQTAPDPSIPGHAELGSGPAVSSSDMLSVMKHVIAKDGIPDVGGFAVGVRNDGDGLNYLSYSDVFFPEMTLNLKPGANVLPFGTAAQGGYAYDIVPTGDRRGVSSYFLQGRFGILYHSQDGGFPGAELITDVDPFEFMDRAKELIGASVSTWHADVRILSARGYEKLKNGDSAGALADAGRAISASGGRDGWILRGNIKSSLGDETGAHADFEEAVRAEPSRADAWNKLALSCGRLGDNDGAISAFSEAVEVDPRFWQAYANRANLLYGEGKFDQAVADITRAATIAENNAALWKKVAAANQRAGRLKDAYAAALTALSLNTDDQELLAFIEEFRRDHEGS